MINLKRFYASLLLLLVNVPFSGKFLVTVGATQWCSSDKQICVYGQPDSTGNLLQFQVFSKQSGWAAVGFGGQADQMSGADMYIGYKSGSSVSVVYRQGTSGQPKTATAPKGFAQANVTSKAPDSSYTLQFAFNRPFIATGALTIKKGAPTTYIWAVSSAAPKVTGGVPDFPSHSSKGSLGADFSANSTVTSSSAILSNINLRTVQIIHGSVMVAAWVISPFIGIFIARYLKDVLGHLWFKLHIFFMLGVTGIFTVAGTIFICLYSTPPHFTGAHEIIGLAVCILVALQIVLGFVSDAMWTPSRSSIPWWDKLHWWLGRLVFLVGVANCHLGLVLFNAPTGWIIGLWVTFGVGVATLVFGQWKFGQIHHVQESFGKKTDMEYNPFSLN